MCVCRAAVRGKTHMMVMSVGWNPYYKNKEKTMEAHLLHKFDSDFYDEELRLVVVGYLRPEADFTGVDALVAAIHEDIRVARLALASVRGEETRVAAAPFLAESGSTNGTEASGKPRRRHRSRSRSNSRSRSRSNSS